MAGDELHWGDEIHDLRATRCHRKSLTETR